MLDPHLLHFLLHLRHQLSLRKTFLFRVFYVLFQNLDYFVHHFLLGDDHFFVFKLLSKLLDFLLLLSALFFVLFILLLKVRRLLDRLDDLTFNV